MNPSVAVLVPIKSWAQAKSRLSPLAGRESLMRAFAQDVVTAAVACEAVDQVYAITDESEPQRWGARLIPDRGHGSLNDAIVTAEHQVRDSHQIIAVVFADLPCITPADLTAALDQPHERWFVPDAVGTGTTFLAAHGVPLQPAFGVGSASKHREQGADALGDVSPRLRRDVDVVADLDAARQLGLGPATRKVLDRGEFGR